MEDNTTKGLHLGTGLIMTLVLAGIAITVLGVAIGLINRGGAQAGDMANNLSNQRYTTYDNTLVQGDTIKSLIAQYESSQDISIVVSVNGSEQQFIRKSTGASKDGKASLEADGVLSHADESAAIMKANDKSDANYSAATKQFLCVVCRDDKTDAITALYFTDDL